MLDEIREALELAEAIDPWAWGVEADDEEED